MSEFDVLQTIIEEQKDVLGSAAHEWMDALSDEYALLPSAEEVLLNVGGLKCSFSGPGVNVTKSDFSIDPMALQGESGFIKEHEEIVGARLFPIGTANQRVNYLLVDENAFAYWLTDGGLFRYENYKELIVGLTIGKKGVLVYR